MCEIKVNVKETMARVNANDGYIDFASIKDFPSILKCVIEEQEQVLVYVYKVKDASLLSLAG